MLTTLWLLFLTLLSAGLEIILFPLFNGTEDSSEVFFPTPYF